MFLRFREISLRFVRVCQRTVLACAASFWDAGEVRLLVCRGRRLVYDMATPSYGCVCVGASHVCCVCTLVPIVSVCAGKGGSRARQIC